MEQTEKILRDYSDTEKGAYLGAIASIATADHSASEEEVNYIKTLAQSAGISQTQEDAVVEAATEISGDELTKCLDILKTSDLRFSLVTDLISFAESDQSYTPEEKASVEKIAQYLNINQEQFSLLKEFENKTSEAGKTGEEVTKPGFLESLGLGDKFKNAGLNMNSVTKGLLGIAGPMILAKLISGGLGHRGMGGGNYGSFGRQRQRPGFGSLTSLLNGGRGLGNSGGLLSSIFGSLI